MWTNPLRPLAITLLLLSVLGCENDRGTDIDDRWADIDEALRSAEFEVQLGEAFPFRFEACDPERTCYYANPNAPYVLVALPAADEDAVPGGQLLPVPDGLGTLETVTRVGTDEAIILLGWTPPAAAYFSFAPYVFERTVAGTTHELFAAFVDGVNSASIHTETGSPVESRFVIIWAADAGIVERVTDALRSTSFGDAPPNLVPLSPDSVRLGTHAESDTITLLGRTAVFEDPAAGDAWLDGDQLRVYRVRADVPAPRPFEAPPRRRPIQTVSEDAYHPALERLEAALITAFEHRAVVTLPVRPSSEIAATESECFPRLQQCDGMAWDAAYSSSEGVLTLPAESQDIIVAYGVNHERTGHATYTAAALVSRDREASIYGFTSREFASSVDEVYDGPEAQNLFAVAFARDCSGVPVPCAEVSNLPPVGVGTDERIAIVFRAYLEPGGLAAPNPDLLINERVMRFER